jgi:hypothetical protein
MAKSAPNQMSFFNTQVDLFDAGSTSLGIATPVESTPRPYELEYRRRRLGEIVGELSGADIMPWKPSLVALWTNAFPNLVKILPEEEAKDWKAKFAAELKRLSKPA